MAEHQSEEGSVKEVLGPEDIASQRLADLVFETVENDLFQRTAEIGMTVQLIQAGKLGNEDLDKVVTLTQEIGEKLNKLRVIKERAKKGEPVRVIKRPAGDFLDLSE